MAQSQKKIIVTNMHSNYNQLTENMHKRLREQTAKIYVGLYIQLIQLKLKFNWCVDSVEDADKYPLWKKEDSPT